MVTIKCNHHCYTSLEDIVGEYYKLVKKIDFADWHTNYAIELDKLGRLHLHGLFTRTKRINPASYRKLGWTIYFNPVNDYNRARDYINKEGQHIALQEQRDCESWFKFNYGFIDDNNAITP